MRRRIAVLAFGLLLAACSSGGGGGGGAVGPVPDPADSGAGCEAARRVATEGATHISPPQKVDYKTNPPTSGAHYSAAGIGPAAPGVYQEAPVDEGLVHNLEHGHVIFWHAPDVAQAQVDALAGVVRKGASFRLLVPRDGMQFKVAFTAWGVIQGCSAPTADIASAAARFADRFQQHAPENIPGRPVT